MTAVEPRPEVIEIIAKSVYERDCPRARWSAKSIPKHQREYYRLLAKRFIRECGGEDELLAFCEAVLAIRALPAFEAEERLS